VAVAGIIWLTSAPRPGLRGILGGTAPDGTRPQRWRLALYGSKTLSSCLTCDVVAGLVTVMRPVVFVDQPAENLMTSYRRRGQVGDGDCDAVVVVWWPQVPGLVRAMLAIVRDVLVQDRAQMPCPGDQHPVGDLGPGGAHPALGIGVRPRAAWRDLHHLDLRGRRTRHRARR
jgi:hypothetical protein